MAFKENNREKFIRLFENVNKIKISEEINKLLSPKDTFIESFEKLKNGLLDIKQSNVFSTENKSTIELKCSDEDNNNIVFTFIVNFISSDEDNTFYVDNVVIEKFLFISGENDEISIELEKDNILNEYSKENQDEIFEVIKNYVDVEKEYEYEKLDEEVVKLIDKIPYKSGSERIVKHQQYADEKPKNEKLRVSNAEELKKFVKEEEKFEKENLSVNDDVFQGIASVYKNLSKEMKDKILKDVTAAINIYLKVKNINNISEEEYINLVKNFLDMVIIDMSSKLNESGINKKRVIKEGYLVVDNEYNRQFFSNYVGKVYDKQIPYAVTKKIVESVDDDDYDITDDDELSDIIDDKKAKKYALKDIKKEFPKPLKTNPYLELNVNEDGGEKFDAKADEVEKISQEKEMVGDLLKGGLADGRLPLEYDPEQILKGIEVEKEHTDNPMIAVEIATDHLEEIPDYYTRLEKMEKEAELDKKNDSEEDVSEYKPLNVGEVFDFAKSEVEYEDKNVYKKYTEYLQRDWNSLTDEEKKDYFELWKLFGEKEDLPVQ